MGINKVVINGTINYEVPDSFMPPLMEYVKMVQNKVEDKEVKNER